MVQPSKARQQPTIPCHVLTPFGNIMLNGLLTLVPNTATDTVFLYFSFFLCGNYEYVVEQATLTGLLGKSLA